MGDQPSIYREWVPGHQLRALLEHITGIYERLSDGSPECRRAGALWDSDPLAIWSTTIGGTHSPIGPARPLWLKAAELMGALRTCPVDGPVAFTTVTARCQRCQHLLTLECCLMAWAAVGHDHPIPSLRARIRALCKHYRLLTGRDPWRWIDPLFQDRTVTYHMAAGPRIVAMYWAPID